MRRSTNMWISVAALALTVGCSGTPDKPDVKPGEDASSPVEVQELVKDVEEMPSAESLGDAGDGKTENGDVSAALAGDIGAAVGAAEKGDFEGAVSDLGGLVDQPNGGYLAAYNIGVIRERQGMYDKAARRYFQTLQKNPDFDPALLNLVRLYLRQDQPNDAERLVHKFMNSRPENLGHRSVELEIALYKGAYEDAISKAKLILRKDERHVGAMFALAQANYRLKRFELARAVIDRAVELDKERADLYNLYGLIELNLKDKAAALANFRKAVELRPQFAEARNNLGMLYHEARDYESAADQFRESILIYPDYKEAFLNLGSAYKGLSRYKDAEIAFNRALELDPNFSDAYFNLGILYIDGEIPGMDTIARYQKSIESFNTYKRYAKNRAKGDPADKYIEEAKKSIEVEKQKQQMERESQMGSEG